MIAVYIPSELGLLYRLAVSHEKLTLISDFDMKKHVYPTTYRRKKMVMI